MGRGGVNMDVLKLIPQFRRMSKASSDCTKCQYHGDKCDNAIELFEKTVAEVEQWSREHPRKTRQSVILEQWPEADLDKYGVLRCCPYLISPAYRESEGLCNRPEKRCTDCRREFWTQEVE